jgi:hypothetical protein
MCSAKARFRSKRKAAQGRVRPLGPGDDWRNYDLHRLFTPRRPRCVVQRPLESARSWSLTGQLQTRSVAARSSRKRSLQIAQRSELDFCVMNSCYMRGESTTIWRGSDADAYEALAIAHQGALKH